MKKLIFSLVAMIAFSSFAMANNVEKLSDSKTDKIETNVLNGDNAVSSKINSIDNFEMFFGCASSCVQYARNIILNAANTYNLNISRGGEHFGLMMEFYHEIYTDCYNNCSN